MRISSYSVYSVFKGLSNISARSDSIQRHPDSLSGAVTQSHTQSGDREASASQICFCAKKKETDNTHKKNLLFLKVTNHIGQETFVFIHEIGLYNMKP